MAAGSAVLFSFVAILPVLVQHDHLCTSLATLTSTAGTEPTTMMCSYHVAYFTFGDTNIFMAECVDQITFLRCTRDFGSFKSCAAGINKDYNKGRISLGKKRDFFLTMFIRLTENYICKWGLHRLINRLITISLLGG